MTPQDLKKLKDQLWEAATMLRSSSGLKSNEYATPILGIVFLRFAETVYQPHEAAIKAEWAALQQGRTFDEAKDSIAKIAIRRCKLYLPDCARYDYLLRGAYKTQNTNIATLTDAQPQSAEEAIKQAMRKIEEHNDMSDTLPINAYEKLNDDNISTLLKQFSTIPIGVEADVFGEIYEFFLAEFALAEGQKGGEFFTPSPVVKLMVEIIEPTAGKLLDPACGSGGMFVHSANYVRKHHADSFNNFKVYGLEKVAENARLAKMNAKINGIRQEITHANTFQYDDKNLVGEFDYVLANPPFNVKDVKTATVATKAHFTLFGLPQNKGKVTEMIPNGNYLWINLFAAALKPQGKAALVMPNSASDARESELAIRQRMIEQGLIQSMLTLSSNMFNSVTLPATIWFFTKNTFTPTPDAIRVLFVDARNVFTQITRKQRSFTAEQIQNLATIFRLYKGENHRFTALVAEYDATANIHAENTARIQTELDAAVLPLADAQAAANLTQTTLDALQTELKTTKEALAKAQKAHTAATKNLNAALKIYNEINARRIAEQKLHDYFVAQSTWLTDRFPNAEYQDVTGLCKIANLTDLQAQNYSLNPGRYVGVVIEDDGLTPEEFETQMLSWHTELTDLNNQAHILEKDITNHLNQLFPPLG
jgi:type I restriction enzyme M protein